MLDYEYNTSGVTFFLKNTETEYRETERETGKQLLYLFKKKKNRSEKDVQLTTFLLITYSGS